MLAASNITDRDLGAVGQGKHKSVSWQKYLKASCQTVALKLNKSIHKGGWQGSEQVSACMNKGEAAAVLTCKVTSIFHEAKCEAKSQSLFQRTERLEMVMFLLGYLIHLHSSKRLMLPAVNQMFSSLPLNG